MAEGQQQQPEGTSNLLTDGTLIMYSSYHYLCNYICVSTVYNIDEATMAQVDEIQKQVCHYLPQQEH